MWVRRGDGQEFARLERKENDENIYYCNPGNPGRAGCNRVGARIQSTDRAAKTSASDGHTTTHSGTPRGRGGHAARIWTRAQPAANAQSVGAGTLRHVGG